MTGIEIKRSVGMLANRPKAVILSEDCSHSQARYPESEDDARAMQKTVIISGVGQAVLPLRD
jgi:hypothetical protein